MDYNTSSHSWAIDEIARTSLDDEEAATCSEKSTPPQSTMECFATQKAVYNMADPADVQRFRAETTKLLILCLKSQCCSINCCHITCKIAKMASLLEEKLFQMAPTLGDYSNVQTLPIRLQIALPRVKASLCRNRKLFSSVKAKQEQKPNTVQFLGGINSSSSSSSSSSTVQRFQQVDDLVKSIRFERHELVAASCAQCQLPRSGGQELEGASTYTAAGIHFGSEFPPAVKQLFFGTPLVALWEKTLKTANSENTATTTTSSTTSIQWEPLVEQAQATLKAFHEWKAQHFLCQR